MKRVISIILFFSISTSIIAPTFAVDTNLTTYKTNEKNVTELEISEDITLVAEDYENGDVVFKQIENGNVTDTVFVDRQMNKLTSIHMEQDKQIKTEQTFVPVKASYEEESATLAAPDYTYVGAIEYRCIPISYTSEVTRLMHLGYMSRYEPNAKYDMYGEYKNLATLAGIVALMFSIPGAIASQAVQWLIWGLGLTATVGPFVIPQGTILNCQKTSYHWRLQDDEDSNRYTMFTGDRYIITEKTAGKTEYKDDFFYVPASYRNRDNDYALEMFRLLYGSMKSVRVSAWKPA